MATLRFNVIIVFLFIILAFLQYRLWFQSGGIRDMVRLKKVLAVQTVENEHLKKQNELLLAQIEQLQTGRDATEARARNELGMIKRDETFYQVVR